MKSNRSSTLFAFLTPALAVCFFSLAWAQSQDAASSGQDKSWTATTEQQLSGTVNPTRTTQSHSVSGDRTLDKQSVQRLGLDGRYEPYLDTEKETIKVGSGTVRTVQRSYGRGPDGQRTLLQLTQEEERKVAGGGSKVVRTVSNPDLNGNLQVVRREIEETKQSSPSVQETTTTVLSPDVNGSFTEIQRIQERQTRNDSDHTTDIRRSTMVQDGIGKWQVSEVREARTKQDGKESSQEERILQPDAEGNLAVVRRTVEKASEDASGGQRKTTETYSLDILGTPRDGDLHLRQRVTTTQRTGADGGQTRVEQVEERNAGAPGEGLRVTNKTIDIQRPGLSGTTTETTTVQSLDANGSAGVVWVDTTKSDKAPAVQVDIAPTSRPAAKRQ